MGSILQAFSNPIPNPSGESELKKQRIYLGNGSEVIYDKEIPWTRPSIHVFGRSCLQPRDTCYVASEGLSELNYSGYQPHAYSRDDFPLLKHILAVVYDSFPGSKFNSLLLNRYKSRSDYVAWHSDDEKLYGPMPEIASVSFGCERDFQLRKKPTKTPGIRCVEQSAVK